MQMKKTILSVMLACVAVVDAAACTSAIISGSLTADGRPILWKHRDTSDLNNKVERIDAAGKFLMWRFSTVPTRNARRLGWE